MGGQTDPTFHPTLVFSMLDEMLDAFDQGFTELIERVLARRVEEQWAIFVYHTRPELI